MNKRYTIALLASAAMLSSLHAGKASFDCTKADKASEKAVCSNAELGRLDTQLAALYAKAQKSYDPGELPDLKKDQRAWMQERDRCGGDSACLKDRYERRIARLQIGTGAIEVPKPVDYRCDKGYTLTVYFYNDSIVPVTIINLVRDKAHLQKLLYLDPSGSGAKYGTKDLSVWEHHGEATVEKKGETIRCEELKR